MGLNKLATRWIARLPLRELEKMQGINSNKRKIVMNVDEALKQAVDAIDKEVVAHTSPSEAADLINECLTEDQKAVFSNMSDKEREFLGAIGLVMFSHSNKKPSDTGNGGEEVEVNESL